MTALLDSSGLASTVSRLADEVARDLPAGVPAAIVGIRSRGEILGGRLAEQLKARGVRDVAIGSLDITLYRDDLAEIGPSAVVRKTEIDFDVTDRWIVLVDDVIYTGRSVRAAIDALVDLGRPRAIRLAVLVDRGGRELPIQPDYVGIRTPAPDRQVSVFLTESDGRDRVELA